MRNTSLLFALSFCLLLLGSQAASAQVIVRGNVGVFGPPRGYYAPRHHYPPRPAVVYAVPRPAPVVVVPAPYYAPRPRYYYAPPRPYYYGHPGRGHGHGRRW